MRKTSLARVSTDPYGEFEPPRSPAGRTGEHALLVAVLASEIDGARGVASTNTTREVRLQIQRDARAWLTGAPVAPGCLSFEHTCALLGFDPVTLREAIRVRMRPVDPNAAITPPDAIEAAISRAERTRDDFLRLVGLRNEPDVDPLETNPNRFRRPAVIRGRRPRARSHRVDDRAAIGARA